MKHFDYIITGAGCAGLSLLVRLLQSGRCAHKKILLVDKAPKNTNDRTWCFWEKAPGYFESIIAHRWQSLRIYGDDFIKAEEAAPYTYKMIRGIDFYTHCFSVIHRYPQVSILYGNVQSVNVAGDTATVVIDGETYTAGIVFNSILFEKPVLKKNEFYLLQHFKGWRIETGQPVFEPSTATLMDFRVPQQHGTAFVYVMPFDAYHALVEYTVFSPQTLPPEEYDEGLLHYMQTFLKTTDYQITEEEQGVIPMTNYRFSPGRPPIINMGTAGGQTKASTGYTFRFIQQQADFICARVVSGSLPENLPLANSRFHFYDGILLRLLAGNTLSGKAIFSRLFKQNSFASIFKFLDNETSLAEEWPVIRSLQVGPFLKAAVQQLWQAVI